LGTHQPGPGIDLGTHQPGITGTDTTALLQRRIKPIPTPSQDTGPLPSPVPTGSRPLRQDGAPRPHRSHGPSSIARLAPSPSPAQRGDTRPGHPSPRLLLPGSCQAWSWQRGELDPDLSPAPTQPRPSPRGCSRHRLLLRVCNPPSSASSHPSSAAGTLSIPPISNRVRSRPPRGGKGGGNGSKRDPDNTKWHLTGCHPPVPPLR